MKRILFFGEPATLAHVVRPIVLARALDPRRYEIAFATGPDFLQFAVDAGLSVRELRAIGTRAYLAAVAAGKVVFPYDVLEDYVGDDLRHLEEFRPDLVVGDFRLSLAVSARVADVPYFAISNAYWTPLAHGRYEVPVHPATRILGPSAANAVFAFLSPFIMAYHSLPMHRLRKRHGLPSLGFDLRRVFTEADVCLLADVPEMVPMGPCVIRDRYLYIGPVTWSPEIELPAPLQDKSDPRPLVYVAMGSSGDPRLARRIIRAALSLGCRAAVSGVHDAPRAGYGNAAYVSKFLPGAKVAALASVVVCNGGSPSTHQALEQGKPVLGIPSNLDQLLNMQVITRWGAGLSVRADMASPRTIERALKRLLSERSFGSSAEKAARILQAHPAAEIFRTAVENRLG